MIFEAFIYFHNVNMQYMQITASLLYSRTIQFSTLKSCTRQISTLRVKPLFSIRYMYTDEWTFLTIVKNQGPIHV